MRPATCLLPLLITLGCGAEPKLYVLQGPPEAETLEPSGVVVVGDHLWVVDDEAGWVVQFSTALKGDAANLPTDHFQLPKAEGLKYIKLEAMTPHGAEGAKIFDIIPKQYWVCPRLADKAPGCTAADVPAAAVAAIDGKKPEGWDFFTFEGMAQIGDTLLFAVRSYRRLNNGGTVQWPWLVDGAGRLAFGGEPWQVDGGEYALSDIAVDGDTLWMTWSWEKDVPKAGPHSKDHVRGVVARATLKDGMPTNRQRCGDVLAGKPEGIAVTADTIYLVFDQDLERKGGPDGFDLEQNQDYVGVVDKAAFAKTCR